MWQRFRAACDLVLRALQEPRSGGDRRQVRRPRNRGGRARGAGAAADATDAPAPDDLYAKVQAARARWLQGPGAAAPHAGAAGRARQRRAARAGHALARRLQRHRPRSRRPRAEDGEAVAKVEALLPPDSKEPAANLSPAELLARQWREALAANTMGAGAARQAEEARQRAAEQEVRSAQSAWLRLGPLPPTRASRCRIASTAPAGVPRTAKKPTAEPRAYCASSRQASQWQTARSAFKVQRSELRLTRFRL